MSGNRLRTGHSTGRRKIAKNTRGASRDVHKIKTKSN